MHDEDVTNRSFRANPTAEARGLLIGSARNASEQSPGMSTGSQARSVSEDAWLRHYKRADQRRSACGTRRRRDPLSLRKRRRRAMMALALIGLLAVCALAGARLF